MRGSTYLLSDSVFRGAYRQDISSKRQAGCMDIRLWSSPAALSKRVL